MYKGTTKFHALGQITKGGVGKLKKGAESCKQMQEDLLR
jgi:hypothetical protein